MSDTISPVVAQSGTVADVTERRPVVDLLSVGLLRPSPTKVQAERRARFKPKALQELTTTIKQVGVLEPILVRPVPEEAGTCYEIVAGERRWSGAKKAGLEVIPSTIRDLTDEQV